MIKEEIINLIEKEGVSEVFKKLKSSEYIYLFEYLEDKTKKVSEKIELTEEENKKLLLKNSFLEEEIITLNKKIILDSKLNQLNINKEIINSYKSFIPLLEVIINFIGYYESNKDNFNIKDIEVLFNYFNKTLKEGDISLIEPKINDFYKKEDEELYEIIDLKKSQKIEEDLKIFKVFSKGVIINNKIVLKSKIGIYKNII